MNRNVAIILLSLLFWQACKREFPDPQPVPATQERLRVLEDEVGGTPVVVVGSPSLNLIVSFRREMDGNLLDFVPTAEPLPAIMEDTEGNRWDVFGVAIGGPRTGQRLTPVPAMMGYWFAISAHYPGLELASAGAGPMGQVPVPDSGWSIPLAAVAWGSSWDGIPAIDDPHFMTYTRRDDLDQGFYVSGDDLVLGLRIGDEVRAYPHNVLNWHEIVNDDVGGRAIAIGYCPLAGTGTAWDRGADSYSVAGLLYNNNLLMFDRGTESVWSQVLGTCVYGDRLGEEAEPLQLVETSWQTWQQIRREPVVMTDETGVNHDYAEDPFLWYKSDQGAIYYPVDHVDQRLPAKERVHAIMLHGETKVWRFSDFR